MQGIEFELYVPDSFFAQQSRPAGEDSQLMALRVDFQEVDILDSFICCYVIQCLYPHMCSDGGMFVELGDGGLMQGRVLRSIVVGVVIQGHRTAGLTNSDVVAFGAVGRECVFQKVQIVPRVRFEGVDKCRWEALQHHLAVVTDVRADIKENQVSSGDRPGQPCPQQISLPADLVVLIVQHSEPVQRQIKKRRIEFLEHRPREHGPMNLAEEPHWSCRVMIKA